MKGSPKITASDCRQSSLTCLLRFTNYMVAMVNKSVLPLKYRVPFLGDHAFLSTGLKFNLELILFKSPWVSLEAFFLNFLNLMSSLRKDQTY